MQLTSAKPLRKLCRFACCIIVLCGDLSDGVAIDHDIIGLFHMGFGGSRPCALNASNLLSFFPAAIVSSCADITSETQNPIIFPHGTCEDNKEKTGSEKA